MTISEFVQKEHMIVKMSKYFVLFAFFQKYSIDDKISNDINIEEMRKNAFLYKEQIFTFLDRLIESFELEKEKEKYINKSIDIKYNDNQFYFAHSLIENSLLHLYFKLITLKEFEETDSLLKYSDLFLKEKFLLGYTIYKKNIEEVLK